MKYTKVLLLWIAFACACAVALTCSLETRSADAQVIPPPSISTVNAGTGLTGGGSTRVVTVNVGAGAGITAAADSVAIDAAYTQRRVNNICPVGNAIRVINEDGSVTCEPAGTISGTGTNNTLAKWTGASSLGDSLLTESGSLVTVGGGLTVASTTHITGTFWADTFVNLGANSGHTVSIAGTTSHTAPTTVQDFRFTTITPAALGAHTDNWNPASLATASRIDASTSGTFNVSGLQGGTLGRRMSLCNIGVNNLNLLHDSTSTATNRFYSPWGSTVVLEQDNCAQLEYAATTVGNRWIVLQKSGRMVYSIYAQGPVTTTTSTNLGDEPADIINIYGNLSTGDTRGVWISPASLGASPENNYNPANLNTAKNIYVTASVNVIFNGIQGGADGRELTICNGSAQTLSFTNENGGATAANRLRMPAATTWVLYPTSYWAANGMECATFVYNGTTSRWFLKALASADMTKLEVGDFFVTGGSTFNGIVTMSNDVTIGAGAGDTLNVVSDTINLGNAEADIVNVYGKPHTRGTAPALSVCGTSPSIVGNDKAGTVTLGTSTPSACTLTFNTAWSTNAPICVVSSNTSGRSYRVSASSTTAITVTQDTTADSASFNYHCLGRL